jgi:hypothetical protein
VSRFVISFDHTERHTTVGRTPLDEGSARRRGEGDILTVNRKYIRLFVKKYLQNLFSFELVLPGDHGGAVAKQGFSERQSN